jgi:hypothetical protein
MDEVRIKDKLFIFLAGLHRSGTSLLHNILRNHPEISGFINTGVPKDEGQHLQTVYEPALKFGGPGKFAFDKRSYMDETHNLATPENAKLLFNQWSKYWDLNCDYLIEKSPPNIIRARFLQKLFSNSCFVVIFRHPVAVSYATQKFSKTSIKSLLDHTLLVYERFLSDMKYINNVIVLRYEELVCNPQNEIDEIYNFLGIQSFPISHNVDKDINSRYFEAWNKDGRNIITRLIRKFPPSFELRANNIGYSLTRLEELHKVSWLGANKKVFQSDH